MDPANELDNNDDDEEEDEHSTKRQHQDEHQQQDHSTYSHDDDDDDDDDYDYQDETAPTTTRPERLLTPEEASRALGLEKAATILDEEIINRPWGGSGDSCVVSRVRVDVVGSTKSLVCKRVLGPSRRHNEDGVFSGIKSLSYKVELDFLRWSRNAAAASHHVVRALLVEEISDTSSLLVMEDLSCAFPHHVADLTLDEAKCALKWLVAFQLVREEPPPSTSARVWTCGGYWALDKRVKEFARMRNHWKRINREFEYLHWMPATLARRLERSALAVQSILYPHTKGVFNLIGKYSADPNVLAELSKPQVDLSAALLTRISELPKSVVGVHESVLLHGDFKAENLFFAIEGKGEEPLLRTCAAVDFQWTGFGVGVIDVFALLSTSLRAEDALCGANGKQVEDALLQQYASDRGASLDTVRFLFDLCAVDFARFIVGSGDVFPEDVWILNRAEAFLASEVGDNLLDRDEVSEEEYAQWLRARLSSKI
jgi:hypothetical protein